MSVLGLSLSVDHILSRGASAPPGFVTDPDFASVQTDGWSGQWASTPPTMQPDTAPRYVVVERQGYTAAGDSTIYTDLFVTTSRVRVPATTNLDPTRVSLSDFLYSTDTVAGRTNSSTEQSPVPVGNWVHPDRSVVGNTFPRQFAEVVAFHRNARNNEQIACVEWTWSDGVNTVTVRRGITELSLDPRDRQPVIVYKPPTDVDISSLSNGVITLDGRLIPWIGGASSIRNSTGSSVLREFSTRRFVKSPTLAANPVYAYVAVSGGDDVNGAVSTNPAVASATPCATVAGAINRLVAVNGSVDGCVIRIGAGTHTWTTSAIASTRAQTGAWLTVERDPNVARASAILEWGTTAVRCRLGAAGGWLRIGDLTFRRTGALTIQGEAASPLLIYLDSHDFNNNSQTGTIFSNSDGVAVGVTFTSLTASVLNAGAREWRMFRGCAMTPTTALESWLVIGCRITSPGQTFTTGTRSASGGVFAYNIVHGMPSASGFVLGASADVLGYVIIQNVFEPTATSDFPSIRVSADSASGNNTHIIIHHNTFAGAWVVGRWNVFYDEGPTARTSKLASVIGNIGTSFATKSDLFRLATGGADAATRTGNWSIEYGVGMRGNLMSYNMNGFQLGSNETPDYPGLRSSWGTGNVSPGLDPLFTDPRQTTYNGTTYTAGAGGGTYTIQAGSPAAGLVDVPVLRFDLAGNPRPAANDAAGAYRAA